MCQRRTAHHSQHGTHKGPGKKQPRYGKSPSTATSSRSREADTVALSRSLPKLSNSYLHQHRNRSSYERTSMAVNLCKVFKNNPEFHPDSANDVTADARKLAKQLGVHFEPGPSDEEEFLRYKYVHDYVWSDADDPEKLAASQPSSVHAHVQQRRQVGDATMRMTALRCMLHTTYILDDGYRIGAALNRLPSVGLVHHEQG